MAENIFVCKHLKGAGYCTLYKDYCHEGPCGDSTPVEYSPVVHGWWEKFTLGTYDFALRLRCSICQKVVYEEEFKFCPYCGARMDDG